MSYHVAIVKTSAEGSITPISRDEVRAAVATHDSLALVEGQSGRLTIRSLKSGGHLILQDGEIWTSNPDPEMLSLMLALAAKLKARVRGDELETYRTPNETYVHPHDVAALNAAQRDVDAMRHHARMRGWLWMASALGFGAALGLLIERCANGQ